jgi:sugar phosphate isomerase/epimerase
MIILSTDSLKGYGLNRIFELTKAAGYDGIDITVDFGQFDSYNGAYLKKLSEEYELPIHAISAPMKLKTDRVKELVAVAKEVGAKIVILQPPKILDFKMASWLKAEVPRLREKEFISIALENAPAETFLGFIPLHTMSNTEELRRFKHVSLDTTRVGEGRKDIMRTYALFKKFLVHIHLSNIYHGKKYSSPQEGILPIESFLTKLKQDRYPGAISIKVLPKYLHVGDDEKVVESLKDIKKYYDKYYTKVEVVEEEKKAENQS